MKTFLDFGKAFLGWVAVIAMVGGLIYGGYWYFNRDEMGGRTLEVTRTLFNATTSASWVTYPVRVDDYRYIALMLTATSTPTSTIKFACSNQDEAPNFSKTASASNHWDYVDVIDTQSNTSIDGDTGISFTASNDVRNLIVNTELCTWFSAKISSYESGSTTLKIKTAVNQ
jgi:hypothetical protein